MVMMMIAVLDMIMMMSMMVCVLDMVILVMMTRNVFCRSADWGKYQMVGRSATELKINRPAEKTGPGPQKMGGDQLIKVSAADQLL